MVFTEACDEAPVLAFWTGDKPAEFEAKCVAADPAPAAGKGCTRVTARWADGGPGYSYWNIATLQPFELRKGVKYTFRGKVYCPGGQVQPKVDFDLPASKVQPIWHVAPAVKGDGWQEFALADLRGIAEALAAGGRWDADTVLLRTLFFNVSGKPAAFAVDELEVVAEGTPLPQFVRPQAATTPFRLTSRCCACAARDRSPGSPSPPATPPATRSCSWMPRPTATGRPARASTPSTHGLRPCRAGWWSDRARTQAPSPWPSTS